MDVTVYDANGTAHAAQSLPTKMWQYVNGANANEDVRIYFNAQLQRLIEPGSVMVLKLDPRPGVEYSATIYPPNHQQFARYDARCTNALPNSARKFGWR